MDNNIENKKKTPNIESKLRHNIVKMPEEIRKASGIVIWGRRIKSLVFTTDIAIIRNCNADAVLAVYREMSAAGKLAAPADKLNKVA